MVARQYEDFRVEISRYGDEEVEVRVTSAQGETTTPVRVALDEPTRTEIRNLVTRLESKRLNQDELLMLGQLLGRYLLPAEVRLLFLRGLERCDDGTGVRLRIVCHDRELRTLPWEYAYIRRSAEFARLAPFLALDQRVSMVRHEPQGTPLPSVRPFVDGRLRVLVAAARNLPGAAALTDDDVGAIRHALSDSTRDLNIQLTELPEPISEASLRAGLVQPTDVLQFVGHGTAPGDEGEGLLIGDGAGGCVSLSPQTLATMLREADVRIAVLSSCYSGRQDSRAEWSGVATALLRAGVPAVVAMQHAIESSHALVFERGFYSAVAAGLTLDEAVALGRRKVTELGVLAEWGIPVLYTRSDGVLFSRVHSGAFADELRREMRREPIDLSQGLEFEGRGDWGKAVEAYMRLVHQATGQRETCHLQLRIGACLWRDGEGDEAEDHLASARRIAMEIGDRHLLGEILLEQGRRAEDEDRIEEAAKRYEEARAAFAETPDSSAKRVAIRQASIDRRRGEFRKALTRLEAEDLDPAEMSDELRAEYLDVLGSVYLARGQYPLAIETLEQALQLDERVHTEHEACGTRLLLAEALLGQGDREAALKHVEFALDTYDESRDESGLSEAWILKGQIHEDLGEYQSALRAYVRASQFDAAGRDTGGEARANRLLGRTALKRGDADAAEDYFNRAHDLLLRGQDELEKAALLTEEAYLDIEEGEFHDAINKLRLVLKMAQEDEDDRTIAIAKRHLATALRESGDLETAGRLLLEALPVLEDLGDLRELETLLDDLGEVLLEQNEFERAVEHLEWSLRLDEELYTARGRGRSLLLLGRAHDRLGRRQKAREYFESAFEVYRSLSDSVGESDARLELGRWYAQEGESRIAREHLQQALRIDRVQEDRLGTVRCHRALAALYRRDGNWARAEEHLQDAESELGAIPDPLERSLLAIEEAELALARGDNREAIEQATSAKKELVKTGSTVDAAICDRLIARALARTGDCDRAIALLEGTQLVFREHDAQLELNQTFDDLAEVHFYKGDIARAREAINESLQLDRQSGWSAGQGRSQLLLGDIELETGRAEAARNSYADALDSFHEAGDEVGQAEVHLRLGTWHLEHNGQLGASLEQANRELKTARRLFQAHQDLRGMSRSFRKLGELYVERNEPQRAEEAFEQAEDCLHALKSDREMAPLALAQGRLYASLGQHDRAISCLERSLALYREMSREDKVHEVLRRLATAHQNVGDLEKALDCIRQVGLEQARIWRVLLENLHEDVASVSAGAYREGAYDVAVRRAIDSVRSWLSRGTDEVEPPAVRHLGEALVQLFDSPQARFLWEANSLEAISAIACAHVVLSLADPSKQQLTLSDSAAGRPYRN